MWCSWLSRGSTCVLFVALAVLVVSGGFLAPYLGSGQDQVLVRNSLLYDVAGTMDVFGVAPEAATAPAYDRSALPPSLLEDLAGLDERHAFATAVALVRYLDTPGPPVGGQIASDSLQALATIRAGAGGYCADYTQVFMMLAAIVGIPAREWGFSFRGYSGDGHAVVEVYDADRAQWIFFDVFNGFYVIGADGRPLSFLELRRGLLDGSTSAAAVVTVTDVSPFTSPDRILHYLRRGVARAYLWEGASAAEAEQQPVVRWLGKRSRALSQLGAIVLGLHPRMLIVPEPQERAALLELRLVGLSVLGGVLSLSVGLVILLVAMQRSRANVIDVRPASEKGKTTD